MYVHEYKEGSSMFSDVDKAISIGILVVNNDQACRNKVAEVLQLCNYQVLHSGTIYDALHAIWENKERLDVVITNAQSLQTEGLAIIQNIKQKLKLNVLLIGSNSIIELKGELFSFSAYLLNGLSINGFNSLLENARRMEESISNAAVETNSLINGKEQLNKKQKAVELYEERSEDSRGNHHRSKKSRVTWTNEMHQRFLDAIERLGYDKAVPKKIVEVMGVTGLTRENVASHLQKYRSSMRRTQETVLGAFPCRNTRIDFEENKNSFVGYRFEGNKIDFGPMITLVVDSDLKGIHGTQPDLLHQNLFQQISVQQLRDCTHQNTPLPQMPQNLDDHHHFDFPELDTFFQP